MVGQDRPPLKGPANSPPMRRAVEYVCMSTEHQKYSTENPSDAIRAYAQDRGFELVGTYADAGKTGLRIEGRKALQHLVQDVEGARASTDLKHFQKVRAIIAARNCRFSDEEVLDRLTRFLQRHGGISGLVIGEADGMSSSGAYAHSFGSLLWTYSLVGFSLDRHYHYIDVNRMLRLFHGHEVRV